MSLPALGAAAATLAVADAVDAGHDDGRCAPRSVAAQAGALPLAARLEMLRRQAGLAPSTRAAAPAIAAVPHAGRDLRMDPATRGDSGGVTATATASATATATDERALAVLGGEIERLRRLLASRPGTARAVPSTRPADEDLPLPGTLIAPGLRYVEHWIPCPTPDPFRPDWCDGDGEGIAPSRLLCLDTETTGLAGGTGTRAFMIGATDWRDGGLRLRQLYLQTLGAEAAMLAEFAGWLAGDRVLVSYNGRCYDAPLLATRYRLARQANPLVGLAHLDLLTPVRRRFRRIWPNCRLLTVERELLGVVRTDDLPGAEAPAAWLGFLRGGSSGPLRRVAAHNAQDIDSLARLLLALQRHVVPD